MTPEQIMAAAAEHGITPMTAKPKKTRGWVAPPPIICTTVDAFVQFAQSITSKPAKRAEPVITWNEGPPPKRGVYATRSAGKSANPGYRYWYGDRWSCLCSRHKYARALATQPKTRNTPLKYPVLWASKGKE